MEKLRLKKSREREIKSAKMEANRLKKLRDTEIGMAKKEEGWLRDRRRGLKDLGKEGKNSK